VTDAERALLWRELRKTLALAEREIRTRQLNPAVTELALGLQGLCAVVRGLLAEHGPELDSSGVAVPLATVVPIQRPRR